MEVDKKAIHHSGWVLKKKKKKMQGYAKRWLVLYEDGTLVYSLDPEKKPRGIIEVPHASMSSDIRHDLKMLSDDDFAQWRTVLRKFLHYQPDELVTAQSNDSAPTQPGSKADQLVNSSIEQLRKIPASSQSAEINTVLNQLVELQSELAKIQAATTNRFSGDWAARSAAGSPLASPRTSIAGGIVGSSASSFTGGDDADFYDANDHMEGAEYNIEEELGQGYDDQGNQDSEGSSDTDEPQERGSMPAANGTRSSGQEIQYRESLPAPVTGEEVSLFSMLKKNVGKDLSTISFPVSFNCPLSLLQAVAEEYEYAPSLLERAASSQDNVERLSLVSAFAVSGYASTAQRSIRKPFNPLLGETYECIRADRDLHFVAEKVVHRPPIVAAYAYGKGWKAHSCGTVKNKFWGKSLELITEGSQLIELDTGEQYSISKPSSFMRNLLAGNKYLEHVGELVVTELTSQMRVVIQFKESSMWGGASSRNHLAGTMYNANNKVITQFKGKWDEQFSRQTEKDHLQVLWEAAPMPSNPSKYYGFTNFALSLNQITPDLDGVLPPTDSRLRPDQRALEEGNLDQAESLKASLENKQRERRKRMEDEGEDYLPQWFHHNSNATEDQPEFVYGGNDQREYFQIRSKVAQNDSSWDVKGADIFNEP
ncbi:Oxysterol-binding protein 3 [Malassezia psittaci]|uniref:Oxysterol-binding protein 3 n=1 Tax=Malassezia psittaci TaxID=1821823 RepID=A0AAF0F8Q6_9BASI|nr:Oxysterol-binding protein 3 [Malassezia psittaci]